MIAPLISVIVPVYNVEAFVERSLKSILNQTYKNLEIIIINDGSTDKSFEICKKVAERDARIVLLEQINQGLSAARNTGISNAKGEYYMFVDSDDWLSENIIEFLLSEVIKFNVKLAMCGYQKMKQQEIEKVEVLKNSETINSDAAIERMLLGEWWSAWAKLFHKSIFEKLRFPHGRTIEDYAILVQILEQCPKVSYNSAQLYFYYTREDSITTKPLNERNFDEILNSVDVVSYVQKNHPQFYRQAERNLGASLIKLILNIYSDKSEKFRNKSPWLMPILKKHSPSLQKNPFLPNKQKFIVWILANFDEKNIIRFAKAYSFYRKYLR